jgi:hypothetical protein
MGYGALTEFSLKTGRRVDTIGIDRQGHIVVVEVKSSEADFRSDQKWPEYLDFCDAFYFAVPAQFPREILPEDCGLIVADHYGGAVLREPPGLRLAPARRRALHLQFALAASKRLRQYIDPGFHTKDG